MSGIYSKECDKLVLEFNNKNYIKKAIFVYDKYNNFIGKYEGVKDAERAFKINHSTIKKYASLGSIYNDYIFSYERLVGVPARPELTRLMNLYS